MGKGKDEERKEEEFRGFLPVGWEGGILKWWGVREG